MKRASPHPGFLEPIGYALGHLQEARDCRSTTSVELGPKPSTASPWGLPHPMLLEDMSYAQSRASHSKSTSIGRPATTGTQRQYRPEPKTETVSATF